MSGFYRLALAAALIAGASGVAQAQSHSRQTPYGQDRFDALYLSSDDFGDRTVGYSGTVPPSESHTVMGLRVPR